MNEFQIGVFPVPGGYLGWVRKVHRASNEILKSDRGHPIVFTSKAEAKAAAGEAMCEFLNSPIFRSGDRIENADAKSVAEAQFNLPKLRARA